MVIGNFDYCKTRGCGNLTVKENNERAYCHRCEEDPGRVKRFEEYERRKAAKERVMKRLIDEELRRGNA